MPSKPRQRKDQGDVRYDIRLTDWRWDYGFSVARSLGREPPRKPYSDVRQVELFGVPIRPEGLKAEAAKIRLLFLVDLTAMEKALPPPSIGDLYLNDGLLEAIVVMPTDVLPSVLAMLTADQFKRVSIRATAFKGSAEIQEFKFHRHIEDIPIDKLDHC